MTLATQPQITPQSQTPAPERHGQPWNEDEERRLYAAFVAGIDVAQCASDHKRTRGGIVSHLKKLGLIDDDGNTVAPRADYVSTRAVQKRNLKSAKAAEIKASRREPDPDVSTPEINERFGEALRLMTATNASIFITGRAGTGKSTLLKYFRRISKKPAVVLAPTGVASLNVGGQTIHNFFRFPIDITPHKVLKKKKPRNEKLYKKLQTIIIDEVSMMRADLLDCVETFLRLHGPVPGKPFGGVQMIFIGDLHQLPPIVTSAEREIFESHYKTPYFFSAHAMKDFPLERIELEKVYRQKDADFLGLLNRVRNNSVNDEDIRHLNSRLIRGDAPAAKGFSINLTATNQRADEINQQHLASLKGRLFQSAAAIEGDFGREYHPTATELSFKAGAQIMMLNNDRDGRWVNGSLGAIEAVREDEEGEQYLAVRLQDDGETVAVYRHTWEVYKFSLADNQIVSEPAGTFTQYPFRLAWAVTIYKSQGKTFERVTIDIGAGTFAAGQMYVALSRCTSFEGITLKTPVKPQHIRTDPRIFAFMTEHKYRAAEVLLPRDGKLTLIARAIREKTPLDIVYLKGNDEKTRRVVQPLTLGDEVYQGKSFTGMKAWCTLRREERVFSVDRILEIKMAATSPPSLPQKRELRRA